ncbi:hypothetical protein EON66_05265 [archaeon]|nr:MAG: hypothetical protein EON66_05265 [archaeon]
MLLDTEVGNVAPGYGARHPAPTHFAIPTPALGGATVRTLTFAPTLTALSAQTGAWSSLPVVVGNRGGSGSES